MLMKNDLEVVDAYGDLTLIKSITGCWMDLVMTCQSMCHYFQSVCLGTKGLQSPVSLSVMFFTPKC